MSKAFYPPETLNKENQLIVAEVRRKIWTNGLIGLGTGLTFGYVMNHIVMAGTKHKLWSIPQATPTTGLAATMICGALFSYGNAVVTGKNEVHTMHHIFTLGSKSKNDLDNQYSVALQQAIDRESSQQQQQQNSLSSSLITNDSNTNANTNDTERIQRQLNRLQRKETLKTRIMTPNGGLSDSHGGTWSSTSTTTINVVTDDPTKFSKG